VEVALGPAKMQMPPLPYGVALPEAVSDEAKQLARRQLRAQPSDPLVVFTGTYTKKNLGLLLHAVAQAKRAGHPCHVWLVGDGPPRHELEVLAGALELREETHFVGLVEDVTPYLRAADIFALPSKVEGLSNPLLEAMAHGLQVVATDVGGNGDAVEDGVSGFLVPSGDETAFAARLQALVAAPGLRRWMGEEARRRVEANFNLEVVVDRYVRLYRELAF